MVKVLTVPMFSPTVVLFSSSQSVSTHKLRRGLVKEMHLVKILRQFFFFLHKNINVLGTH